MAFKMDSASQLIDSSAEAANGIMTRVQSFQLPTLTWSARGNEEGGTRGGSQAMPIAASILPSLSSFRTEDGDEGADDPEASSMDWGIAGAPCSLCASLSWKERLAGFAVCYGLGTLLTVLSFGSFAAVFAGAPERFALTYSLGNILNVGSTCFLVGPQRQWTALTHKSRRIASAVYFSCIIFTLLCVWIKWSDYGLRWLGGILTFTAVGIQCLALGWYAMSYVPFGRTIVGRMFQSARSWLLD